MYHLWYLFSVLIAFVQRIIEVWFIPAYILVIALMFVFAVRHILQAWEIE